ncbi:MAG: hypothetical protein KGN78_14830, partial [Actinomycetales bacterium]|nr:hypothetical protein [Actinomycetales bacterium]
MSRTSTTVGRRQSIPAWMTAAAVVAVLALALVWRAAPAMADTAPAATPTVAPTTAATVAPTTVAPVSTGAVGSRAAALRTYDQCSTSTATDSTCPIEMSLVAKNLPPNSDTGWRVGDVINLQLKIQNKGGVAKKVIALSAGMDFNPDELGLVSASTPYAPVPTTTAGVGAIFDFTNAAAILRAASGTVGNSSTAYINANKFKLVSGDKNGAIAPNVNLTGKLDLDFEILGADNAIALAASGASGDSAVIGEVSVRVQKNPDADTTYIVALRGSRAATTDANGDMYRNSVVVDGTNSDVLGRSILGKVVSAGLSVMRTKVTVSLEVATPAASPEGRGHRVGDLIAVDVVAEATGTDAIARNATSMDLEINVDSTKFVLVDGSGTDTKVLATAPVVKPAATDPAFGSFTSKKADNSGSCVAADATNNFYVGSSTNKITLNLDGSALDLRAGTAVKRVIGRFWVRPNYNGASADQTQQLTVGASPVIGIREYDANCASTTRFQVATDVNVTSPVGDVVVKPTTVYVKLEPQLTTNQVIRVGDLIKVKYLIDTRDAKYVNTVRTTITYNDADLILVDSTKAPIAASTGVAVSVSTSNPVDTDIAGATASGTDNRRATTGTPAVSTITLNVAGDDTVLAQAAG